MFISLLLVINYYNIVLPTEETLSFIVPFLLIAMEVELSNNKMFTLRMRTRFDFLRSKAKIMTFDFLMPKQKYEIYIALIGSFLATLVFGLMRENFFTSFLLFFGVLMFFFYVIDYIIQCVLLAQSIVYENIIVNKLIESVLFGSVGTYMLTFMIDKYIKNEHAHDDFFNIFGQMQWVYAIFYSILLTFFVYRLYKVFAINHQSMQKATKQTTIKKAR